MNIDKLPAEVKEFYRTWSYKEAFACVVLFVLVLLGVYYFTCIFFTCGYPVSKQLALHPRDYASVPAILLSNFFHADVKHLLFNLLYFVPLGLFVFKQEGVRGFMGIFIGMLVAGGVVWLFGETDTVTAGFSGAVFACLGILLVRSIRENIVHTAILLVLAYIFMEHSIFETLRPTTYTKANNISWLGHLGGLIGGMMAQIQSQVIALEMLYKNKKVTEKEFVTISLRIHNDDIALDDESDDKPVQNSKVSTPQKSTVKKTARTTKTSRGDNDSS